jgi:hypothetical protein
LREGERDVTRPGRGKLFWASGRKRLGRIAFRLARKAIRLSGVRLPS